MLHALCVNFGSNYKEKIHLHMQAGTHTWSFSTIGGVKRVNLDSGNDLAHLQDLDPKLWTALSCPVNDLEVDSKTLQLIDTDKDGQIRVPDVIDAVNWMISAIKNPDDLLKQSAEFPLSALDISSIEGKILFDSARVILKNLGKEDEAILTVTDTSDTTKIFSGTRFNGDGVITEDTAGDQETIDLLNEIIKYSGSVTDRSGKQGVNDAILTAFWDQCEKYDDWQRKKDNDLSSIQPFGADTAMAYENFVAVKAKIDDFFLRCKLAAFDAQSVEALNLQTARVQAITDKDLSGCIDEIAAYPIARIEANGLLPLSAGINPAWQSKIALFREQIAGRLFPGKDNITEEEWNKVTAIFNPFAKWTAEQDGTAVEALGTARIREILTGSMHEHMTSLIEQDKAVENEASNIILVDKLVRYYRDLFTLLKNFVTFVDFYTPGTKAVFQAGTLYIDQRSCDLCIKVSDMTRQSNLAPLSGIYLIYCECVCKSTNEKMTIAAALTNGDVDDLVIGRNALFFDRKGNDWDATIVKIIENPTSVRQAFFAPYRRLVRFVETQVNKAATAADEKSAAKMKKNVEDAPGKVDDHAKDAPAPQFDVAKFAGIFAAIGLAIGAIGTAMAAAVGGFMKLTWWKMPLALMGILLIISGPSMILAYLKLRKRNLAPVLDANGWAINARVKINIQFGRTLTAVATLPKGAKVNFNDPFMQKKRPFIPILIVLTLIAGGVLYMLWRHGIIHIRTR